MRKVLAAGGLVIKIYRAIGFLKTMPEDMNYAMNILKEAALPSILLTWILK